MSLRSRKPATPPLPRAFLDALHEQPCPPALAPPPRRGCCRRLCRALVLTAGALLLAGALALAVLPAEHAAHRLHRPPSLTLWR